MTKIEWTDKTLNAFVGCSIVSAGCKNCYAMRMAYRLEHAFRQPAYQGTTRKVNGSVVWTGRVNRSSTNKLNEPRGWRKPHLIFVNSMSDFWHEAAEDAWRQEVMDLMRDTPQHAYQVLTKRPENIEPIMRRMGLTTLPSNFWLGATVEDERVADRIALLRAVPAEVRFLSVEPITRRLGKVDLSGIHWVITGGESGPGARMCMPGWIREVRDQAVPSGVAFFHKQWGTYRSNPLVVEKDWTEAAAAEADPHGKGGGLLDGRLWREMPVRPVAPAA